LAANGMAWGEVVSAARFTVIQIDGPSSEAEVMGTLRKAMEAYAVDNIAFIHPDCGLRSLERDSARGKLKNMVSALKSMKEELK